MKGIYNNIALFLAVGALVSDKDKGLYLVESLCETLDARIGEAINKEKSLDAKVEEIALLNGSISEMKKQLEELTLAKSNADNSASEAKKEKEQLLTEIENLKAEALKAKTEADALNKRIEELAAENEEKAKALKAKDEEINALSNRTAPAPAHAAPEAQEQTANPNVLGNVTKAGMTLMEMQSALSDRIKRLSGQA